MEYLSNPLVLIAVVIFTWCLRGWVSNFYQRPDDPPEQTENAKKIAELMQQWEQDSKFDEDDDRHR